MSLKQLMYSCQWSTSVWHRVTLISHYSDVIMSAMPFQITSLAIVYSPFIQEHIKKPIKTPRHWPLWGKFTGDRWIRWTKGQWRGKCFHWRNHVYITESGNFFTSYFLCWTIVLLTLRPHDVARYWQAFGQNHLVNTRLFKFWYWGFISSCQ